MFIALSVADGKDYIWALVLERIAALDCPAAKVHCTFDHAPEALKVWREWKRMLPAHLDASETVINKGSPPPHLRGGYPAEILKRVMSVQEGLRQRFLETNESHCLWVECDQVIPPCLGRRLAARNKSIVMALTPARLVPTAPNACTAGNTLTSVRLATQLALKAGALYEVGSVGLGCTLVKRHVLEMVGWENPEALITAFGNGGDVTLSRLYWERTGENPWLDCSLVVPHVDCRDETLLWHTFEQDAEGRMVPKTEVIPLS